MTSVPPMLLAAFLFLGLPGATIRTIVVHGHPQNVHLYGTPGGPTAVVASGDGGWIHLAPHIAEVLAAHGWFVVGFDSRAYLSSAADAGGALSADDIPRDYETLISATLCHATACPPGGVRPRPILIGVSEGAGLSLAAAIDPAVKQRIGGVVAVGLGDNNELAWHMRDAVIYVTKGIPKEPMLHATAIVGRVAPAPLAFLRSTRDEFVPAAESDRLIQAAGTPKASWTITAGDHRFSDNLKGFDDQLIEALSWIGSAVPAS